MLSAARIPPVHPWLNLSMLLPKTSMLPSRALGFQVSFQQEWICRTVRPHYAHIIAPANVQVYIFKYRLAAVCKGYVFHVYEFSYLITKNLSLKGFKVLFHYDYIVHALFHLLPSGHYGILKPGLPPLPSLGKPTASLGLWRFEENMVNIRCNSSASRTNSAAPGSLPGFSGYRYLNEPVPVCKVSKGRMGYHNFLAVRLVQRFPV